MPPIASPAVLNPLPLDPRVLAQLGAASPGVIAAPTPAPVPSASLAIPPPAAPAPRIAAPGRAPRAYNIPGIQPPAGAQPDATLRSPGIASPARRPATLMPPDATNGPAPMIAAPSAGPSPNALALQQAKDAESAIKPPNYTGKLGVLEKIGDVAGRLLAPGIEQRLGVGTIGYQQRLAQAQGNTDRLEKQQATEAATDKAQADAQLEEANANKVATAQPPEKAPDVQAFDALVKQRVDPVEAFRQVTQAGSKPTAPHLEHITVTGPDGKPMQANYDPATGTVTDSTGKTIANPVPYVTPKSDGLAPEIEAQLTATIGQKPDPKNYPGADKDPKYLADLNKWGKAAEELKNAEAQASGFAHGAGYNATRPVMVFNPQTGNFEYMTAQNAENTGAAPGTLANSVMGRQAQIADIESGSQSLRAALTAPGLAPFSPTQTAQLSLAMRDVDPGAMRNAVTDLMASGLTPQQQDLVADLFSMQERALSLRSVAGMGQGSDTMRHAIIKALPNITSGSTSLALKQLDVFDNLVANLAKGIGGVKGSKAEGASASPVGTVEVTAPNGAVFRFKDQGAADQFKKEAGIK